MFKGIKLSRATSMAKPTSLKIKPIKEATSSSNNSRMLPIVVQPSRHSLEAVCSRSSSRIPMYFSKLAIQPGASSSKILEMMDSAYMVEVEPSLKVEREKASPMRLK